MWGAPQTIKETVSNPFKYSGEYWDDSTNLQYLRARWYDPSMGRFINEDTYQGELTNPLSLNLYTYVYNNPLKYTDPTGHEPRKSAQDIIRLLIAAQGTNKGFQVYWDVRAKFGAIAQVYMPSKENNNFIYLFNMAIGNHYDETENTSGNREWAANKLLTALSDPRKTLEQLVDNADLYNQLRNNEDFQFGIKVIFVLAGGALEGVKGAGASFAVQSLADATPERFLDTEVSIDASAFITQQFYENLTNLLAGYGPSYYISDKTRDAWFTLVEKYKQIINAIN